MGNDQGPHAPQAPSSSPVPEHGAHLVPDYYAGHKTRAELDSNATRRTGSNSNSDDESLEKGNGLDDINPVEKIPHASASPAEIAAGKLQSEEPQKSMYTHPRPQGSWKNPGHWGRFAWWAFMRGVRVDVVGQQTSNENESKFLHKLLVGKNLADKHARVVHYDTKVEHLYSFLQVMTAATASFTHGANDVANAMGPMSAIHYIWMNNVASRRSEVPIWILVYGGAAISIGCWTYGYNLIRNLGNRITLHSPCRGFCMELGAAVTVVIATRLALPVSTTQCIIGATVGVGLCAGDYRAINWRMVAWSYSGWFITLPCTGLIAGLLTAFVINAPSFGNAPAAAFIPDE